MICFRATEQFSIFDFQPISRAWLVPTLGSIKIIFCALQQ